MFLGLGITLGGQSGVGGVSYDVIKADEQFYAKDSYFGYLSPWGTDGLIRPDDYEDTLRAVAASFPADSRIDWRMPTDISPAAVWGYLHLGYGNYDGSTLPVQVTPRQISGISTFTSSFDWRWTGSTNFNLLHEFYLTATAHQTGALSDKQYEIGPLLHAPPETIAFHNGGSLAGTWNDGTRAWTVRGHPVSTSWTGTYFTILPDDDAPVTIGTLNCKSLLTWLVANAGVSDALYVNGIGFGVEPTDGGGQGACIINDWNVAFS